MTLRLAVSPLAAVAAALLACAAARAEDVDAADARCLGIAAMMQDSRDPGDRNAAAVMGIYYFGRLDGRSPQAAIDQQVIGQLAELTPERIPAERLRCGEQLARRGQVLKALGERLQQFRKPPGR